MEGRIRFGTMMFSLFLAEETTTPLLWKDVLVHYKILSTILSIKIVLLYKRQMENVMDFGNMDDT